MQQLTKALRTCHICGLQAHTEADLELFQKDKTRHYGRNNRCKRCHNKDSNERNHRVLDKFLEIFKTRSPDGYVRCYFCGEEIMKLRGWTSDSLFVHSLDGNHENWEPTNKAPTHHGCHNRYHLTGEKSPNWKGNAASEWAKRGRS